MSQVTLEITFSEIVLRTRDSKHDAYALSLAGKVDTRELGVFRYKLSAQNMEKINKVFDGVRLPKAEVIKGHNFLNALRDKYLDYKRAKSRVRDIMKLEQYPLEPNGKFMPYAHQTKIVAAIMTDPQLMVGADCFLPGTLIKADGKYIPIEDVILQQKITTLDGEASVCKTMSRKYSGTVVTIKTASSYYPITVTDNHAFPVVRKSRCVIKSRANTHCSNLCNRKCPSGEDSPHSGYSIEKVKASSLTLDDCLLFPVVRDISDYDIPDGLLKIMGYWLAEGCFTYKFKKSGARTNKMRALNFSFGLHEEFTIARDCKNALEELGYKTAVHRAKRKTNVYALICSDRQLAEMFMIQMGQHSHRKQLPTIFKELSNRQKLIMMECLFKGDAHYRDDYVPGGRNSQSIRFVTTSYQMASETRDALLSMGIRCQAYNEQGGKGRDGSLRKTAYRLIIPRRYSHLFDFQVDKIRKDLRQDTIEISGNTYSMIPIRKLQKHKYSGPVYNLTSSGHDTYLTDSGVAHNCGTGKTGSTARAVELLLQQKQISKGKVLVTAPLSILETSWVDDIKKFTNLNVKVLWTPKGNKTLKIGDKVVIGHGVPEKPEGAMTVKTSKSQRYVKDNAIKPSGYKLNVFDDAEGGWEKMEVTVKEAIMPGGEKIAVGPIYGHRTQKENTKEMLIQSMLADPETDLYLINHDGVRNYEQTLKDHSFEWIVIDESTKIKSPSSGVFKAHVAISWNAKRRTTLTGTPNPNGFMDLWSQYYFLDRGLTFSTSVADFRHDYFKAISLGHFGGKDAVKWEMREDTKELLIEKVKDSAIFLKQRDCVDLPPRTDMIREVVMTAEQSRIYVEMEKELVAELIDRRTGANLMIEASNTLAKLMKLRQITSGFVGHSDGVAAIESLSSNPKYEEMDDFIDELGGNKLVIACQFKEEIYTLLNRYKHLGIAAIFGDVKDPAERKNSIWKFQNTNELQIMVLQPQAAAHGITLTEAAYFAFLSLDYNFEYYYQLGKRIERIGQKNPMFVNHFLAKTEAGRQTIDHDLMHVLKSKSTDRDVLFDGNGDIVEIAAVLTNRLIERNNNN